MTVTVVAAVIGLAAPGIARAQSAAAPPPPGSPPGPPPGLPAPPPAAPLTFGFMPLPPNPYAVPGQIIDEVKAGLLAHDVGFLGDHIERGFDVDLEMLFTSPDFLSVIGSPRPHIGADINTAAQTSDAFAGLTWGISVIQNLFRPGDYVFMTGSLGGAYQDGYIDNAPLGRKELGSPILFRESAELGYQVTPRISVSAILDHISNANLGQHNAGITSAGARIGFKF
ncbi:MAG TPA: acyloxyacyl hydrolase [Stellaceae bacterium]|nr:acyloxyacyl hydrolase [Stellaceae bacterium]